MIYYSTTREIIGEATLLPQGSGAITLQIKADDFREDTDYYIELACQKNKKYCLGKCEVVGNKLVVDISTGLLVQVGEVYVQIVMRNITSGKVVDKSLISNNPFFVVTKSVNAELDPPPAVINDIITDLVALRGTVTGELDQIDDRIDAMATATNLTLLTDRVTALETICTVTNVAQNTLQKLANMITVNQNALQSIAPELPVGSILRFDYSELSAVTADDMLSSVALMNEYYAGQWTQYNGTSADPTDADDVNIFEYIRYQ